jgi:hypothetical protein
VEKYLALVGMCMSLRNLSIFIQLRSISKSWFSKINNNSDITPPNNVEMITFEILLVRDFVYQGITTLINSAYKNRGHVQVVPTNLKQRRMYNLTMSCGGVLLDKLRHFFNYEKIITAKMHLRGNDDVDNKTSDEMNRKMGNKTNRATTHT